MSEKEIPIDVRIRIVIMIICGFVMMVLVSCCFERDKNRHSQPESVKDKWDSLTIEQQSKIANDLYKARKR